MNGEPAAAFPFGAAKLISQRMAQVNLTSLDSLVDEVWGKPGTARRDELEANLKAEAAAHPLGGALALGEEGRVKLR